MVRVLSSRLRYVTRENAAVLSLSCRAYIAAWPLTCVGGLTQMIKACVGLSTHTVGTVLQPKGLTGRHPGNRFRAPRQSHELPHYSHCGVT